MVKKRYFIITIILIITIIFVIWSSNCIDVKTCEKFNLRNIDLRQDKIICGDNVTKDNLYLFNTLDKDTDKYTPYIYDIEKDKFYRIDELQNKFSMTLCSDSVIYQDVLKFDKNESNDADDADHSGVKGSGKIEKIDFSNNSSVYIGKEKYKYYVYGDKYYCYENEDDEKDTTFIEINVNSKEQNEIFKEGRILGCHKMKLFYFDKKKESIFSFDVINGNREKIKIKDPSKVDNIISDENNVYIFYYNGNVYKMNFNTMYKKIANIGDIHFDDEQISIKNNAIYIFDDSDMSVIKINLENGKKQNLITSKDAIEEVAGMFARYSRIFYARFCKDYIVAFITTNSDFTGISDLYDDADYLLIYDYNGKLIKTKKIREY